MSYQRKDAHYRRAKSEGRRARSAYKLAELDDRFRLLRRGDRVVDLGAWPGGWVQVALERIGEGGRVVAVDLVPLESFADRNVRLLVADVTDPGTAPAARELLGDAADVVLSDLSPKLSGVRDVDEARGVDLVRAVTDALPVLLRPSGRVLLKVFMGASYQDGLARLRATFETVRATKPAATRKGSAELYLVGTGYRPPLTTCG